MTNPFDIPQQPAQQQPAANPFGPPAQQQPPAHVQQPVQAYAPPMQQQAPQYAAPAPATPMQQQYAPTAEHSPSYAPAPAIPSRPAGGAPPALDPNALGAAPAPEVGAGGADLVAMYGRLVLVLPMKIETVPRSEKYITPEQRAQGNTTQEKLTATVVVLDDGQMGITPIAFGGAPHELPPRPHTESAPLPYVRKAMWIRQSRLISQLRDKLPTAPGQAPGMALGRVVKAGPAANDPWELTTNVSQAEIDLGTKYLQGVAVGHFPHPLA